MLNLKKYEIVYKHLLGYVILGLLPVIGWVLIIAWTIIGPNLIQLYFIKNEITDDNP
jgi:hypothetical protein